MAWGHTDPGKKLKDNATTKPTFFVEEQNDVKGGDAKNEAEKTQEFRVGATEATSSIQGFCLPGLTWVDSPGLHSQTKANEKLSKEYVQHADLILYTMSSDCPAKNTDLAEVDNLWRQGKQPLIIITGSDMTVPCEDEDDEDEDNFEIITIMKPQSDRMLQVENSRKELEMLSNYKGQTFEVLSISARYAQEKEASPQVFQESGMAEFFNVMADLIKSNGIEMKRRTPMTNFLHFIEECVEDTESYRNLFESFEKTIADLRKKLPKEVSLAQSQSEKELRELIDSKFDAIAKIDNSQKKQQIKLLQHTLNAEAQTIAQRHLKSVFEKQMKDFQQSIEQDFMNSKLIQLPNFSVETIDRKVVDGVKSGTKARNATLGSAAGGAIGSFFGPIGTLAGATLGGLIGSATGDKEELVYKTITLPVSDNFQMIHDMARQAYTKNVQEYISSVSDTLIQQVLQEATLLLEDLKEEVDIFVNKLSELEKEISSNLS